MIKGLDTGQLSLILTASLQAQTTGRMKERGLCAEMEADGSICAKDLVNALAQLAGQAQSLTSPLRPDGP